MHVAQCIFFSSVFVFLFFSFLLEIDAECCSIRVLW